MSIEQAFPTHKLYEARDMAAYQSAKQAYIKQLAYGRYANKSSEQKWQILIDQFASIVPDDAKETLFSFQRSRAQSTTNSHNLSLEQCIDYFEHFYFLYTTDNPDFELTESQKKRLLELVIEAINTCETGKNTRFNQIIQEFTSDEDWMAKELANYRYQILLRLQEGYNAENHVDPIWAVHTLNTMLELAEKEQLGITIYQRIEDAYLKAAERNNITRYFYQHYLSLFFEYEHAVVKNLSFHLLHALNEIKDIIADDGFDDWYYQDDAPGFLISSPEKQAALAHFINLRFTLPEGTIDLNDFGEWNDDYTVFQVKKKDEFFLALESAVEKKLIHEHYFFSYNELAKTDSNKLKKLGIQDENSVVQLHQALCAKEHDLSLINRLLKKATSFILRHPGDILAAISQNPKIIFAFPAALKANPVFIQNVIGVLDKLLAEAIDSESEETLEEVMASVLHLVQYDSQYAYYLSENVLNTPKIAEQLLQKNGLLLQRLSPALQDEMRLVEAAIHQNPYAIFCASERLKRNSDLVFLAAMKSYGGQDFDYEDFLSTTQDIFAFTQSQLPSNFHAFFQRMLREAHDVPELLIQVNPDQYFSFSIKQTLDSTLALLEPEISPLRFMRLSKHVTPDLLLEIINYRKREALKPLPFCSDSDMIQRFMTELQAKNINVTTNGWHAARKKLSQSSLHPVRGHDSEDAIDFLLRSNHWFTAMVRYEKSITSRSHYFNAFLDASFHLLKQLMRFCLHSIKIIGVVCALMLTGALLMNLIPILTSLIPSYIAFSTLGFALAGDFLLLMGIRNPAFIAMTIAANVFSTLIIAPIFFPYALTLLCVEHYIQTESGGWANQFREVLEALMPSFSNLFRTILPPTSPSISDIPQDADLQSKCEHAICRLQLMEEESAHEKGELLESLFSEIESNHDMLHLDSAPSEEAWARQLNKPHTFSYQGQSHQMSFFDVASARRNHAEQFRLQENNQPHSFFSRRTTTARMIDCESPEFSASSVAIT